MTPRFRVRREPGRAIHRLQNVANSRPPYFNGSGAYDNLVASPVGRMVTLGLAAKF